MADVITERLRLRQHAERDQQAVVGLLTDEEVRRYVGGARSEVAARALIRDRGVGRTGAKGLHLDHVLVDDVAWPLVQHAEPPFLDEDWRKLGWGHVVACPTAEAFDDRDPTSLSRQDR